VTFIEHGPDCGGGGGGDDVDVDWLGRVDFVHWTKAEWFLELGEQVWRDRWCDVNWVMVLARSALGISLCHDFRRDSAVHLERSRAEFAYPLALIGLLDHDSDPVVILHEARRDNCATVRRVRRYAMMSCNP